MRYYKRDYMSGSCILVGGCISATIGDLSTSGLPASFVMLMYDVDMK